jgi:ATP-dependent DNA helicase RecG
VYPLIEESEKLDLKSAEEGLIFFQSRYPHYSCALLHGRLPTEEKEKIMSLFSAGTIQVLVSTTVIEVGVDVPNANMMIIFHAERFGLSQLHQLRGRIGRGTHLSYCYLVGNAKTETAKKRLNAMLATTDGFQLAEFDLAIRGPGEMLGTKQSGLPEFKLADLTRDEIIVTMARKSVKNLMQKSPDLSLYPPLRKKIEEGQPFGLQLLN